MLSSQSLAHSAAGNRCANPNRVVQDKQPPATAGASRPNASAYNGTAHHVANSISAGATGATTELV
jgi:hypothetical protein